MLDNMDSVPMESCGKVLNTTDVDNSLQQGSNYKDQGHEAMNYDKEGHKGKYKI